MWYPMIVGSLFYRANWPDHVVFSRHCSQHRYQLHVPAKSERNGHNLDIGIQNQMIFLRLNENFQPITVRCSFMKWSNFMHCFTINICAIFNENFGRIETIVFCTYVKWRPSPCIRHIYIRALLNKVSNDTCVTCIINKLDDSKAKVEPV